MWRPALAWALLTAAVAIAVILVAGRFLLRPLFSVAGRTGSRELIMAMTLLMVIGVAALTGYAGLSTALGAFLAGVLLSETEYRHQIEIDVAPFKGLLVGLFFITVGMSIDVRVVWGAIGTILLVVALAARGQGLDPVRRLPSVRRGAERDRRGGDPAGAGRRIRLHRDRARPLHRRWCPREFAQGATAVVGISMVLTPFLAIGARALAGRMQRDRAPRPDAGGRRRPNTDHVIIGGYGRVGQVIAGLLRAENVPFVALDTNAELASEGAKRGEPVFFGDAARARIPAPRRGGAAHAPSWSR